MKDFKSNQKMQCFKEGGQVKYESRKEHKEEMSAAIAQDKKIVKKAFAMHDKQEHKGEKTDLSKLNKGGRAKKDCGTVKKYCGGKSVKKMADGRLTGPLGAAADMQNLRMLGRAANAKKYLGPAQQSQFINQGGMNTAPAAAISTPAAAPSAPVNQMGDATGMGNIPYRKGGKVKKGCK